MGDGVLMAGAGKKTFSAGETLLASDVNSYLMDQAVMVFDDASARTTAIPSPSEGMVTYLRDVDLVQAWNGAEWVEISGGASVTVSETAPSSPDEGDLWFSSSDGRTFVYYTDVDGSQWVEVGTVFNAGGEDFAPKFITETTTRTANYTLALDDVNKVVPMDGSSLTLTIPTNASVAFPLGAIVNVYNLNASDVTIAGDTGVTVRNGGDLAQYGEVSLRKRATDEWVLAGSVS